MIDGGKNRGGIFQYLRRNLASPWGNVEEWGRVVSEMMGHATYSITADIYQAVPDEMQRIAADHLDTMLGAVASGIG